MMTLFAKAGAMSLAFLTALAVNSTASADPGNARIASGLTVLAGSDFRGGTTNRFRDDVEDLIVRRLKQDVRTVREQRRRLREREDGLRRSIDVENDDVIVTGTGIREDESYRSSFLREAVSFAPLRPRPNIIHVPHNLKVLGEERAARRAELFKNGDRLKYFRFYRPTEAYDYRYPSVVYLDNR